MKYYKVIKLSNAKIICVINEFNKKWERQRLGQKTEVYFKLTGLKRMLLLTNIGALRLFTMD